MIDVPFNLFFERRPSLLKEGGNVTVTDVDDNSISAEKLNLHKHTRTEIVHKLVSFFEALNDLYEESYNEKLWPVPGDITNGHIFNGSSEHFFNLNISDDEFLKYKSTVGDVDVTVPNDKKENLFELLNRSKGRSMSPDVTYVGSKQKNIGGGHQINSIVNVNGVHLQIDFEFLEYVQERPSKFAKFSHSSDWEDIKQGFKGVLHKYLLQSLAGGSSIRTEEEVALFTKTATKEKPRAVKTFPEDGITLRKFSVDRGLRTDAYGQYFDEEGEPVMFQGKPAYKETPTDQSKYVTDPESIAKEIFGSSFVSDDLPLFGSFVGVVKLINKYNAPKDKISIFNDFFRRLFGAGVQGFEKNNPALDYDTKRAGYMKLRDNFSITAAPELPETFEKLMSASEDSSADPFLLKVKKYYENYKMVDGEDE